jgi:hypothetical protein
MVNGKKIRYCADYAWFLKAQKSGFFGIHVPQIIGHMNEGGASSDSQVVIGREAMKLACLIFPEKKVSIRIIWNLRMAFNSRISNWLQKTFPLFTLGTRKIYSIYLKVSS